MARPCPPESARNLRHPAALAATLVGCATALWLAAAALHAPVALAQTGVEATGLARMGTHSGPAVRFKVAERAEQEAARGKLIPGQPAQEDTGVPRVPRKKSGAPGRIGGLVYERGTTRPVPGVRLVLTSTEPQYDIETYEARTDSAGYYEFASVEPGRWYVGVEADRLPATFAAPRAGRRLTVARRDSVVAPAFELTKTACVAGHAVWSDGYVLYDAPITVAPRDTTLYSVDGLVNGVGDFQVCGAAEDSVMVWMTLRDGRRLGRSTRLVPGETRRVEFSPQPMEQMDGSVLRVQAKSADGKPVGFASLVLVGRRFELGDTPACVYTRDATADAGGLAELRVPNGVYEILVSNPRDGQIGRIEQYVVNPNQYDPAPLQVAVRGQNSARRLAQYRQELLDRGEMFLYIWTQ